MISLFAVAEITAQESGNLEMREYPVSDFSKVEIEGNYRVYLHQVPVPYLRIYAPHKNLFDELEVDSNGRTLELSVRKKGLNLSKIELHIGFSALEDLRVKGGITMKTNGYIEVSDLEIYVEGGVSVDMKMKARTLAIHSAGGALFELAGVADRLSVRVAGAGHVNARELTAREVLFKVEGVGFGAVYATDLLDVQIEGAGKVTYKGTPKVNRIVEGLGSVVRD